MKVTPKIKKLMLALPVERLLQSTSQLQGHLASPDLGSESDFNEYKSYEMGDEVRRIDWKVYARTEKLYIKKYSSERSRDIYLVFDASLSMAEQKGYLEVFYFLIYYLYLKHERYGLILLKENNSEWHPSGEGSHQLQKSEGVLNQIKFEGGSDYFKEFVHCIQKAASDSEFIFFSDFQNTIKKYQTIISTAKKKNIFLHGISCFNPRVLSLPSEGSWIEDNETREKVYFSKNLIKDYEKVVFDHYEELKIFFNRSNVRFTELNSDLTGWNNFLKLF